MGSESALLWNGAWSIILGKTCDKSFDVKQVKWTINSRIDKKVYG